MRLIQDLGMMFPTEKSKQKKRFGLYECPQCNIEFKSCTADVKNGKSTMCKSCSQRAKKLKHGFSKSKYKDLYTAWKNMKARCYGNALKDKSWQKQGVTISKVWIDDPEAFVEWSLNNGYKKGMQLDKDILCEANNISPKIYSPETCLWVSQAENIEQTIKDIRASDAEVNLIRNMYRLNFPETTIAKEFNRDRTHVNRICKDIDREHGNRLNKLYSPQDLYEEVTK